MRKFRALLGRLKYDTTLPLRSQLYNEHTFYGAFEHDIRHARQSVVIESPFITQRRFNRLYPLIAGAAQRGVQLKVNTRDPDQHEGELREQATQAVAALQSLGVTVLYTGNLHRKLAIIDNEILWEGSLNILSQNDSCEIMRRSESQELAKQMITFTGLAEWYT